MKTRVLLVLLSIVALPVCSQNIGSLEAYVKNLITQKQAIKFQLKKDSLQSVYMSEKWDTLQFNPYKNEPQQFPLHITFEDANYASPMGIKKVITSRYGWRNRRAHKGIDIDLVTGDDVYAMLEGKVRYVGYHAGHGKTVVVRHNNGLETVYTHLSKYLVAVNDVVSKGQVLGLGGRTGNARGSHLHLEVSYRGVFINPEYLFDFSEENNIRNHHIWVTKNWTRPSFHSSRRQSEIIVYETIDEALASQIKQREVYTIKRGDTLSKIANTYSVPISQICKVNGIKKSSVLRIGQKITVIK